MITRLSINFLVLVPVFIANAAPGIGPFFTTVDVPGARSTSLLGINSQAFVVGQYSTTVGTFAFVFDGVRFETLQLPGNEVFIAGGINDMGQIAGLYEDSNDRRHGYIFDGSTFTTVDYPGAQDTGIGAINNSGVVLGTEDSQGGDNRSFMYDGSTFTTIDVPGSIEPAFAFDINDAGVIVGTFHDGSGWHGFILDGTTYTTVDVPGALGTAISGINNLGQFVGSLTVTFNPDDPMPQLGYFFDGNEFTVFPCLSTALDINDDGIIASLYQDARGRIRGVAGDAQGLAALVKAPSLVVDGVFMTDGTTTSTVIDESAGLVQLEVRDVNDSGTVAFFAKYVLGGLLGIFRSDGQTLTPIVDPVLPFPLRQDNPFDSDPSINNSGKVAFVGRLFPSGEAVYVSDGSTMTTIADFSGRFSNFGRVSMNNSDKVVFGASLDGGATRGIFTGPDPVADKVVQLGDMILGDVVTDLGLGGTSINDSDQIVFVAKVSGLSLVVRADPLPGGGYSFTQIGVQSGGNTPSINSAGVAAFAYTDSILKGDGGPLTVIADLNDGFSSVSGGSINNSGEVAFTALTGNPPTPTSRPILKGTGTGNLTTLIANELDVNINGSAFGNDGKLYFSSYIFPVPQGPRVTLDIDPQRCPNVLNYRAKGKLRAAVMGTEFFDVLQIDLTTVQLEGISPLDMVVQDVGTVLGVHPCNNLGGDGFNDLELRFATEDITAALGPLQDGDIKQLTLTATLLDGTPIQARDVVLVRIKGRIN